MERILSAVRKAEKQLDLCCRLPQNAGIGTRKCQYRYQLPQEERVSLELKIKGWCKVLFRKKLSPTLINITTKSSWGNFSFLPGRKPEAYSLKREKHVF